MEVKYFLVNKFGRIIQPVFQEKQFSSNAFIRADLHFNTPRELDQYVHDYYYNGTAFVEQLVPPYTYSHIEVESPDQGDSQGPRESYREYVDASGEIHGEVIQEEYEGVFDDQLFFSCSIDDTFIVQNVEFHEDLRIEAVCCEESSHIIYENDTLSITKPEHGNFVQIFIDHPHLLSRNLCIDFG